MSALDDLRAALAMWDAAAVDSTEEDAADCDVRSAARALLEEIDAGRLVYVREMLDALPLDAAEAWLDAGWDDDPAGDGGDYDALVRTLAIGMRVQAAHEAEAGGS